MDSKQRSRRAPLSRSARWQGFGVAVVVFVALPWVVGCGDNRLPQVAVPRADGVVGLPRWYPEKPWSAKGGDSRVYIEGKIVFDTNRSVIRPGSEKVLGTLLQFVNEHTEVTSLRIEGHTDSTASDEYNQGLSARRSLAVADWLVDHGVDHTRLIAVGFGEGKPMAPNEVAAGRAENRRTEFHVVEVNGRPFMTTDPTGGGMVLEVLSSEDRRLARERAARPRTVPAPKPFSPTGDEIKPVGGPGPIIRPRDKSAESNDG